MESELRRAERALPAQERHFQFIVEGLPAIIALFSPDGRLIYCNRQMLEYLDETFEQVQARASAYNFHPDERDGVLAAWAAAVQSGAPFDREARLQRADGVYRWHRTRVFPLRDPTGEIELWYGLSTDIEAAKRAEALLAGEKRLLEEVARGLPLSAVLDDLCGLVEDLFHGCYCSILLIDPDGARFRVGSGPSLPPGYNAILDGLVIDPGYGPCSVAVVQKTPVIAADPANDPRWKGSAWPPAMAEYGLGSCWSMPVLSGAQEVLGIFAIYRREPVGPTADEQELVDRFTKIAGIAMERARADATLKATEVELSRANAYLTEAQRLSKTGSFTWDVVGEASIWSEEMYRIFDLPPDMEGSPNIVRRVTHPDDLPILDTLRANIMEARAFDIALRLLTAGGPKHAHLVAHRIDQTRDRPVFVGAVQDVTEQKVAEEALSRARAELAHVARVTTLSALTASIAHEVNQPLSGIITNASTCLRMLAADPPNVEGARATAQRTIRDGNRASEVIQRLRSLFSRRAPGIAPVDLNEAAREVIALSAGDLQRRKVIVRADLTDELEPVRGDRVQLQQVILNLLLNAADAMSAVEDRPRELSLATARDATGQVALRVRDSGVGIEPENLERLFDPFYTTKAEGMGIGLSISRSIIEAHQGRLWASANEGPGMTFSFAIPSGQERAPVAAGGARASQPHT